MKKCILTLIYYFAFMMLIISISLANKGNGIYKVELIIFDDTLHTVKIVNYTKKEFPYYINSFNYAKRLYFEQTYIEELYLERFSELEELTITHCFELNYNGLIDELSKNNHLKTLILNNDSLDYISPKIKNINSLEVLDLTNNRIDTLPAGLFMLKNLKDLILRNNTISDIDLHNIRNKSIEYIDLSKNKITKFPNFILNCDSIKSICFSDCKGIDFYDIIEKVAEMDSIEMLDLSFCELSSIPLNIEKLSNLKYLYIIGNNLSREEREKIRYLLKTVYIE